MPRPRGRTQWVPNELSKRRLQDIEEVFTELDASGIRSLTARQMLYKLMSKGWTKDLNGPLLDLLANARRTTVDAWNIPLWRITEDKSTKITAPGWPGMTADGWLKALREDVEGLRLDRQEGQPRRLLVWCEAAGLIPAVQEVALEYGVSVWSGSGYDSITAKTELAQEAVEWADSGLYSGMTVLHIGDHDLHGKWIFRALAEDAIAWAKSWWTESDDVLDVVRIAVTKDQIDKYGLPGSPTDPYIVQAEALDPVVLRNVVRSEIESRQDGGARARVLRREEAVRDEVRRRLFP